MIPDFPPFEPPYITRHTTEQGTEYVQNLADGTTRRLTASEANWIEPPLPTAAAPLAANMQGKTYLNVPFAEKDAAKALGARWDAAKKKWYVPSGVAAELFERWM
jgi:hypothetical protein